MCRLDTNMLYFIILLFLVQYARIARSLHVTETEEKPNKGESSAINNDEEDEYAGGLL